MSDDKEKTKPKKVPIGKRLDEIEKELFALREVAGIGQRRMDKLDSRQRAYDPEYMLQMEARHTELSGKLRLMIDRTTLSTEIGCYARNAYPDAAETRHKLYEWSIWILDQPADVVKSFEFVPLGVLAQKILDNGAAS